MYISCKQALFTLICGLKMLNTDFYTFTLNPLKRSEPVFFRVTARPQFLNRINEKINNCFVKTEPVTEMSIFYVIVGQHNINHSRHNEIWRPLYLFYISAHRYAFTLY